MLIFLLIEMCKNHPSILKINQEGYLQNRFSFAPISKLCIHNVISNIDSSISFQNDNIPPEILKEIVDICSGHRTCFDKFVNQHLSGTGSSPAGSISRDLNSQKLHY